MRTRFPAARIMGLVLSGCVTLMLAAGCSFLVGTNLDLVPVPENVAVKGLPQILSCEARFVEVSSQNTYERVCGCNCWDAEVGYYWCCRTVWRHTDFTGEIVLRLVVEDPSNDLAPGHSPRVRVMDALPVSTRSGEVLCPLAIVQTDIPIMVTNVVADGTRKTVTVRIRGISLRFTPSCRLRGAVLPMRVLFSDGGQQWMSANQQQAVVEVPLPAGYPFRGANDVVIYNPTYPHPYPYPYPCPCPSPCPHPCPRPCPCP